MCFFVLSFSHSTGVCFGIGDSEPIISGFHVPYQHHASLFITILGKTSWSKVLVFVLFLYFILFLLLGIPLIDTVNAFCFSVKCVVTPELLLSLHLIPFYFKCFLLVFTLLIIQRHYLSCLFALLFFSLVNISEILSSHISNSFPIL